MQNIKTILIVVAVVVFALYIGGCKISTNPFKVEFTTWYNMLGYLFVIAAVVSFNYGIYIEGYETGAVDMMRKVKEEAKAGNLSISKEGDLQRKVIKEEEKK